MFITNLFYLTVVASNCLNICSGIRTIPEEINLQISEETTIKSPGYPEKNYESNTIYTWMVTAPDVTEEIYIRIEMDIHHTPGYACDDYLQIQEIITDFTLFKQCGKQTRNRIARGNKLMIIFFSNHDRLTDKGFRVRLKVSKILTKSTKSTKVPSPMSKTPMAPETKTTTKTKDSFPQRTKIGNKEIIRSTKTATITVVTTKKSRETNISTVFSNWKATKPTTPKVIMSEALSSTPTLYTSSQPPHSTTVIYKTSISAPVIITSGSSQSATSPEEPISSSIKLSTETSTTESIPINQEIVLLMMGIGVVEVTIIIVGVLAVKRFRQKKKSSRTSKEANDRRPVSRKTVFGIDNEYDTIPFDESDENPYKDLSEGVYDATSKRRSHVNGQRSNYSRGSFFLHLFNKSNVNERKSIEARKHSNVIEEGNDSSGLNSSETIV